MGENLTSHASSRISGMPCPVCRVIAIRDRIETGPHGFHNISVLLNLGSDGFKTRAGGRIDDDWQVLYFGENNPAGGQAGDSDGDHQDNLFEFTAGLPA